MVAFIHASSSGRTSRGKILGITLDILECGSLLQAVINSGVSRRLVELLVHPLPSVVSAALRAVGNIVTGDDVQTQVILNCSALPALLKLLSAAKVRMSRALNFRNTFLLARLVVAST